MSDKDSGAHLKAGGKDEFYECLGCACIILSIGVALFLAALGGYLFQRGGPPEAPVVERGGK